MEPGHIDREDALAPRTLAIGKSAPQWSPVISTGKTAREIHPFRPAETGHRARGGWHGTAEHTLHQVWSSQMAL